MMRFVPFLLVAAFAGSAAAKDRLPEPTTYAKEVGDGQFVFVQHGTPEADATIKDSDSQAKLAALREKYPKTGLYSRDGTLVWTVEGFAPSDNVFVSADGEYLARLEGESWRTKEYPAPNKLPPETADAQLNAPAVSFFRNGTLIKSYPLKDVLTDPEKLWHSPLHVLWMAGAVLNDGSGKFLLNTQDMHRVVFDFRTGEVLSRGKVGLGNPIAGPILLGSGLAALALLGGWAWWAFGRRH